MKLNLQTPHSKACAIACELVEDIRLLSRTYPESEDMGMVVQVREAVMNMHKFVSFAAFANNSKDFNFYIDEALGKSAALEIFLELALELGYCNKEKFVSLSSKVAEIRNLIESPYPKPTLRIVK